MNAARVADWGFSTGAERELLIGGISAEALAREHGTPLHVIDEMSLVQRAGRFARAFAEAYPAETRVHFAMKCNDVPGVVAMVLSAGLALEVSTSYEWWLALRLGARPADLIVNGPLKGVLLETAIRDGAGLVVLDGLDEMDLAVEVATRLSAEPRVLLRLNPDCVHRGMNRATATGSRKLSMFGFDIKTGEADEAFSRLAKGGPLKYAGLHCHVGSGIRHPRDYERPITRLLECAGRAARLGLQTEILDFGGGIGVASSRELTTREYLVYHALGRLPPPCNPATFPCIEEFASVITSVITRQCERYNLPLPRLRLEPGRAIASSAGVLLVRVGRVKARRGVGTWAIADGGAGTVAFPLFYELHEILHARTPEAIPTHRYDLVGGACFSADWLYRGKRLPELRPGDILAVCDAGAYFSVQESNFGFAHPPIVAVRDGAVRLLRRRESWPEMISRDVEGDRRTDSPAHVVADARMFHSTKPSNRANRSALKFRRLTAADVNEAASVFALGFNGHDLFSPALGLERTTFGAYFNTLIPLALNDPRGVVLGAEWNGRLAAVLVAARPGFPSVRGGLRHLREFARAAGWRGLMRYLRFSRELERFLHRPKAERETEFRGLWLAADPSVSGQRAGAFLVRAACDYSRRIGYPLQAAVVDGANKPLVAFYERHGFRVVPGGSFLGGRAVRMEHRFS